MTDEDDHNDDNDGHDHDVHVEAAVVHRGRRLLSRCAAHQRRLRQRQGGHSGSSDLTPTCFSPNDPMVLRNGPSGPTILPSPRSSPAKIGRTSAGTCPTPVELGRHRPRPGGSRSNSAEIGLTFCRSRSEVGRARPKLVEHRPKLGQTWRKFGRFRSNSYARRHKRSNRILAQHGIGSHIQASQAHAPEARDALFPTGLASRLARHAHVNGA